MQASRTRAAATRIGKWLAALGPTRGSLDRGRGMDCEAGNNIRVQRYKSECTRQAEGLSHQEANAHDRLKACPTKKRMHTTFESRIQRGSAKCVPPELDGRPQRPMVCPTTQAGMPILLDTKPSVPPGSN